MNDETTHDDELLVPPAGLSRTWRWIILLNSIAVGVALILSPILYSMFVNQRDNARDNQASVNAFFCSENNRQDRTLGRLLEVAAGDGEQTFGAGIDPAKLSPFDVRVLRSIAKVQQSDPRGETVRSAFHAEQERLQNDTPCHALALRVAEATGADPDSIEIIRLAPEIRQLEKGKP